MDAKELVRTALTCVNSLMDLINDQLGNVASSPDLSSGAEERKIAIPAEDLLSISSTLQNLTAQLAVGTEMISLSKFSYLVLVFLSCLSFLIFLVFLSCLSFLILS